MADFGQLTGQKTKRAEKFRTRLQQVFNKNYPLINEIKAGADAIISATAKFLAGFGSQVARLNKDSTRALTEATLIQRAKMRDQALAELTAQTKEKVRDLAEKFNRGRIDELELRRGLQATLRQTALTAAIIGVGGVANLTENVLTAVQRQLTNQFEKLDGFINEVRTRDLTQRDMARFGLYANAAFSLAQTAARQFTLDQYESPSGLEERRILGGAEHCDDCIALASLGWQPAGTLPPIGVDTVCGDSCRCTIVTRPTTKDTERVDPVPEAEG